MLTDPLRLFNAWFIEESKRNDLKLPAACCLSTVGLDGYPNARFVSLKEVTDDAFVVTGPLASRKGREMQKTPKAALTFWWTATERQVRIQGDVTFIPDEKADTYFAPRNYDSKIVSNVFEQGKAIPAIADLRKHFEEKKKIMVDQEVHRPQHWGGIYLHPLRIEFMIFRESRLHERTLWQQDGNGWEISFLQP